MSKPLIWSWAIIFWVMMMGSFLCLNTIRVDIAKILSISSTLEKASAPTTPSEKVVKVVGKCTVLFDGLGATTGYVVEGEHGYEIVPSGPGSMADLADSSPEFLVMMKDESGIIFQPLLVQK